MRIPDSRHKLILPRKIRASSKPRICTKNGWPQDQGQSRRASSPGREPSGRQPTGHHRPAGGPGPKPAHRQPKAKTGPAGRPRRSPRRRVKKNDDSIEKIACDLPRNISGGPGTPPCNIYLIFAGRTFCLKKQKPLWGAPSGAQRVFAGKKTTPQKRCLGRAKVSSICRQVICSVCRHNTPCGYGGFTTPPPSWIWQPKQ